MMFILIMGVISLWGIRIEGFPKLPADSIEVSIINVGMRATQIDQSITRQLEESLTGIRGIEKTFSVSYDDQAIVYIVKQSSYELERLLEDVKQRINTISYFPKSAERPVIQRKALKFPALIVQVYGDLNQDTLQRAARKVKDELLAKPEISHIEQWGERKRELNIEISPQILESYGLNLQKIATLIRQSSMDYRTGTINTSGGYIQLSADNRATYINDYAKIPIITLSNGAVIKLGDIAKIKNDFEDDDVLVMFQGKPTIGFEIHIDNTGNLIETSRSVHEVINHMREKLPDNIKLEIWADQSVDISNRLALLQKNAWQGLLLVFLLLALFLNMKLAFWVALGIPVSIAGTLFMMTWGGINYSLNELTTFSLILVLGIIVDDAIIVGESIFSEQQKNTNVINGTEKGVKKVAVATIFGALTTIAAFYPWTIINDSIGKIFSFISVTVIIALLFSLFESKFLLPAHLTTVRMKTTNTQSILSHRLINYWKQIQLTCNNILNRFNKNTYQPLLSYCLNRRYFVLLFFTFTAFLIIGLMVVGNNRIVFYPDIPSRYISVNMTMDARTPHALILENTEKISLAAQKLNSRLIKQKDLKRPPIEKILVAVIGSFVAEFHADLGPEESRIFQTTEILNAWRNEVGKLEGVEKLSFSAAEQPGGGFYIEIYSDDEVILQTAVTKIRQQLNKIDGVSDIQDELIAGKPEIKLHLKPIANTLGISLDDIAIQIGDNYGGLEILRFQHDLTEVKVVARYTKDARNTLHDVLQAKISLDNGKWIPLSHVVSFESHYVLNEIWHQNNKRVVSLSANINKLKTSPMQVYESLQKLVINQLLAEHPQLKIKSAGEIEQEVKLRPKLLKAFIISILLIYVLLAIPLKSYWQPLVIMSVIPFGFCGAILGHIISGIPFSIFSFFGMLALAGVVVNDSLVMMTCYNQLRKNKVTLDLALIKSGSSRLRAIFLTTITTTIGLFPLLLETSEHAQYLIPAAVSLVYGELFATTITLILIPVLIKTANDITDIIPSKTEYNLA